MLQEGERDPNKFCEDWKLGGDDGIDPNEINIVGLLHISRGTWMPILQLARHIIPRCDFVQEREEESHEDPTGEGTCGSPPSVDEEGPVLPKRKGRKEGRKTTSTVAGTTTKGSSS